MHYVKLIHGSRQLNNNKLKFRLKSNKIGPPADKRALRATFFEIYFFVFFKSSKSWVIKNGVRIYDYAFVLSQEPFKYTPV